MRIMQIVYNERNPAVYNLALWNPDDETGKTGLMDDQAPSINTPIILRVYTGVTWN